MKIVAMAATTWHLLWWHLSATEPRYRNKL